MASAIPQYEVDDLCRRVSSTRFVNRQLSSICSLNGLRSSGVKLELQRRIKEHIINSARDPTAFYFIKQSIDDVEKTRQGTYAAPPSYKTSSPSISAHANANHSTTYHNQAESFRVPPQSNPYLPGANNYKMPPGPYNNIQFKPSPFYELLERLGDVKVLDGMPQHRNSAIITVRANDTAALRQCASDPSLRVMLFCAGGDHGLQDIAFPQNSELKVNDGDIKANMRGLKGKPGSTRPVDITDHLRLRSNNSYANTVTFTYALTEKKFYLMAFVCRAIHVETLVQKMTTRKIPRHFVLAELRGKMDDEDVVATSQVLSLKCPISYMRLGVPCRSWSCKHIQCFDATSYLQLQEQGPQWACPICNKPAPFEQLAVDEYVQDILQNTSNSAEQVTIEPDGRWHTGSGEPQTSAPVSRANHSRLFDDDDVIAIIDDKPSKSSSTPTPSLGTPATGYSREGSSLPKSVGAKRSVIDLTLSSDDEEEPPRQVKRTNYGYPVYNPSNAYT